MWGHDQSLCCPLQTFNSALQHTRRPNSYRFMKQGKMFKNKYTLKICIVTLLETLLSLDLTVCWNKWHALLHMKISDT